MGSSLTAFLWVKLDAAVIYECNYKYFKKSIAAWQFGKLEVVCVLPILRAYDLPSYKLLAKVTELGKSSLLDDRIQNQ